MKKAPKLSDHYLAGGQLHAATESVCWLSDDDGRAELNVLEKGEEDEWNAGQRLRSHVG
jgi:hypothetical protein